MGKRYYIINKNCFIEIDEDSFYEKIQNEEKIQSESNSSTGFFHDKEKISDRNLRKKILRCIVCADKKHDIMSESTSKKENGGFNIRQQMILSILINKFPDGISKDEIIRITHRNTGISNFDTIVSRLRKNLGWPQPRKDKEKFDILRIDRVHSSQDNKAPSSIYSLKKYDDNDEVVFEKVNKTKWEERLNSYSSVENEQKKTDYSFTEPIPEENSQSKSSSDVCNLSPLADELRNCRNGWCLKPVPRNDEPCFKNVVFVKDGIGSGKNYTIRKCIIELFSKGRYGEDQPYYKCDYRSGEYDKIIVEDNKNIIIAKGRITEVNNRVHAFLNKFSHKNGIIVINNFDGFIKFENNDFEIENFFKAIDLFNNFTDIVVIMPNCVIPDRFLCFSCYTCNASQYDLKTFYQNLKNIREMEKNCEIYKLFLEKSGITLSDSQCRNKHWIMIYLVYFCNYNMTLAHSTALLIKHNAIDQETFISMIRKGASFSEILIHIVNSDKHNVFTDKAIETIDVIIKSFKSCYDDYRALMRNQDTRFLFLQCLLYDFDRIKGDDAIVESGELFRFHYLLCRNKSKMNLPEFFVTSRAIIRDRIPQINNTLAWNELLKIGVLVDCSSDEFIHAELDVFIREAFEFCLRYEKNF